MNIKVLSDNIVNQIAAGEVVERPASVIKEIVENSIDAGADRIEISVKNGGASFISVSDNGSGMSKDDLSLSIRRYATSKLAEEDLFNINTFGFRGEALASISSIAKVSIKSKLKGYNDAWELTVDGGKNVQVSPTALNEGTKIEVRDLFYATPARLKFLKADTTEFRYIRDVIEKIAMANPEVTFSLINNDKKAVSWEKSDLKSRINSIIGAEFADRSIELKSEVNGIKLYGYVGVPTFNKVNVMSQFVFVNGRPVKDKLVMGAIKAGYMDVIEHGRYPVLALFIELPPKEVDVNVHPAKTEVRFKDTQVIRSIIVHSIREAIENNREEGIQNIFEVNTKIDFNNKSNYPHYSFKSNFKETIQESFLNSAPSTRAEVLEEVEIDTEKHFLGSAKAQLHKNYIISQTEDSVFIIDQHAAHERIVYEKIKENLQNGGVNTQNLLIPEIVDLKQSNIEALLDKKEELFKLGLEIENFGEGAIIVRSLPALLTNRVDIKQLIIDLSDEILELGNKSDILKEKLYEVCATIACHGSVRSGRVLSILEMNELLRQMELCNNIQQCNHGRPTYVKLSLNYIEKLFDR